jgi:predicted RNA-binding Zn-ribbon protein involved in translation (DUF1610 family)
VSAFDEIRERLYFQSPTGEPESRIVLLRDALAVVDQIESMHPRPCDNCGAKVVDITPAGMPGFLFACPMCGLSRSESGDAR